MVRVSPSGGSGGGSDGGSSGVDDVSVNLVSSGEGFAFDPSDIIIGGSGPGLTPEAQREVRGQTFQDLQEQTTADIDESDVVRTGGAVTLSWAARVEEAQADVDLVGIPGREVG